MAGMGAGYDLSVSTFSPEGRVFQVEYAMKATDSSGTLLACRCSDGLLIGVDHQSLSKLAIVESSPKIFAVDRHCAVGVCGFIADGRQIAQRARGEAEQYRYAYGDPIPGHILAERLALYVHAHTLAWSLRPLGATILLCVFDEGNTGNYQIYCIDPSGCVYRYAATAVGKGRHTAKTELEKIDLDGMTCREVVNKVARIMYRVQDDRSRTPIGEYGWICEESNKEYQRIPKDLVNSAIEDAKQHLEEIQLEGVGA